MDPPPPEKKEAHVDTYYKRFCWNVLGVGSLRDLGLRTTQRAVLINKCQYFFIFCLPSIFDHAGRLKSNTGYENRYRDEPSDLHP